MGHIYINKNFQGRFQTSKLFGQNPPCTIKLNGEKSINTITTNITRQHLKDSLYAPQWIWEQVLKFF